MFGQLTRFGVPPRWRYVPTDGRDFRLDLLRGWFVVMMILDHIAKYSWLAVLTGGDRFYASGAEGFVFISGLLVGVVHARRIARDGFGSALRNVLGRALRLYALMLVGALLFVPPAELLPLPLAEGPHLGDPIGFAVALVTLHRSYHIVDVLLLYVLLLAISAPIALFLLARGRTAVCLCGTWLLWGAFQVWPGQFALPWPIPDDFFDFSAWQALFTTALVLGYHRRTVARFFGRWSLGQLLGLSALGVAAALTVFFAVDLPLKHTDLIGYLPVREMLVGKSNLGPGRLLAFVSYFGLLYCAATVLWVPLVRVAGWFLLPLGRRALFAFMLHLAILFLTTLVFRLPGLAVVEPRTLAVAVQLPSVALVWWLVRQAQGRAADPTWAMIVVHAARARLRRAPSRDRRAGGGGAEPNPA